MRARGRVERENSKFKVIVFCVIPDSRLTPIPLGESTTFLAPTKEFVCSSS
jgi:hypothetical protein